tara:strand:- start:975 stop:1226 length:252 start_codon:yes stop_codon:yes gene_type:complete
MSQIDLEAQINWLEERGFILEDVAEGDTSVYMKPLGLITLIAECRRGVFTYSSHVSWDGRKDRYATYPFKRFEIFHECLNKLQ